MRPRSSRNLWRLCGSGVCGVVSSVSSDIGGAAGDVAVVVVIDSLSLSHTHTHAHTHTQIHTQIFS